MSSSSGHPIVSQIPESYLWRKFCKLCIRSKFDLNIRKPNFSSFLLAKLVPTLSPRIYREGKPGQTCDWSSWIQTRPAWELRPEPNLRGLCPVVGRISWDDNISYISHTSDLASISINIVFCVIINYFLYREGSDPLCSRDVTMHINTLMRVEIRYTFV